MRPHKLVRAISLFFFLFAPLQLAAATAQFQIYFDTDNNPATGCSAVFGTDAISGVEQVLTTSVEITSAGSNVTGVTRQQCDGSTFGSPITVDTGAYPIGTTGASGNSDIETRIPISSFGASLPAVQRLYVVGTSSAFHDALLTSPNGDAILFPENPGRRHAVAPGWFTRSIVLDGRVGDWNGVVPLVTGGASGGVTALTINSLTAFAGSTDLYFLIEAKLNLTAPLAVDDSYQGTQGHSLSIPAPGVLGNDISPTGSALSALLVSGPQHGTLTLSPSGGFNYLNSGAPAPVDQFTYKANDGTTDSNTATVTIHLNANSAPIARNDSYSVNRSATLVVPAPGVLANDSDPDGDSLKATLHIGPSHGTVTVNLNGSFTYTNDGSSATTDSFTYRASDGSLFDTATVTITITCPSLVITNPATNTGTVGTAFSQTFTSTGGTGAVTFSTASTLPAGLTFSSTGVLSGIPSQFGTFPIVVSGTDSTGCTNSGATYTLTINCQPITVTNPATSTGVANSPFSQTFTQTGAIGAATFTTASTLPAGLTLSTAGLLSGTPTQTGSFPIVVTVTDSNGCTGTSATYTLTIACQTITVTNPATNTGVDGTPFSQSFTQTGGIGTVTLTTASTLPAGLALSSSGVLAGTPTQSGTFNIVVTATDANGCTGIGSTYSLSICVTPSVSISASTTTFCAGTNVIFTAIPVSGGASPAYQWKVNGINAGSNSPTFATNTLNNGDQVTVTMTGNASPCSSVNPVDSNTITVTVNANPAAPVVTPTPAQVCANTTGNTATGPAGATTYAWSIVNGTITSATNTQSITYTAGASGTVDLTLVVTNAAGCSASSTTNVTINANPATPAITPTPAQVCGNTTGNTANGPAGATTYAWSIVNGTITSATNTQSITYTAGASGTMDLTLVVTNASGCSATNTVNVPINASPATPILTPIPAQVCANSIGNTAGGPAGATTYAWSIVNGTITSATNTQAITYTAGASGTVDLTLVVTNGSGCSATNTVNVPINANPATPAITPTPATVCANSIGSADGPAGATTYAWSIVNGTITSATNIQTITYTAGASGTVDLTLVVTNASGCSASNTVNVTINANPSTPTITPTPAQVCGNSLGNTADGPAGATTYAWSIVNGTITSATNIQTITYTAGASGTVDLTLVVTNASGCSASNTASVPINASPATPSITPTPAQVCGSSTGNTADGPAGATTYAWSIVNGTITSATNIQTITYTAGASGTVDLTLVVTNAAGCSATNTVNITITAIPTATPSNGGPYCEGNTIALFTPAVGGATYAWTGPNGFTSTQQNPTRANATLADAGTYSVTVTVSGCSSAAGTTNVVVNPVPATPTASNGGPYCEGATIALSTPAVGGATYSWTGPNGFTSALQNPTIPNATLADAGTYSVTVTVNGCSSAAGTTNVVVNPVPATPTASNGGPYCEGATIALSTPLVSGATYSWTGPNGFTSSLQNPTRANATVPDGGTYSVTVTVNGCTSAAGTTNVVVNAVPATPTASNGGPYCAGATIALNTAAVGGATYLWTGPNGFTSSLQNPTVSNATLADAGTYSVTVTVNGCTSAAGTTNVVVNANPATPAITPTPSQVCANATGNTVSGPAGATTYSWSIVNGTITSATNTQSITYTAGAAGTVDLTLVVTNAAGCPASNTVNVTINANPATPAITPIPGAVCANSIGNTASGPAGATTYAWSIVNGTITSATNTQSITYTAGAAGTVGLTLVVTNAAGCSASNTANVPVNANPATPTITPTPATLCGNSVGNTAAGPAGATTYAWSIVNGTITSATNVQTITYDAGAAGTVGLTLVVTNAAGCSASNTINVPISNTAPVVTTVPLSQSVQSGSPVTFTAAASGTPAPTVQWQVSVGAGPFTDIGGATSTSYSFTPTLGDNGNQYRAVFTNACGTATTAAATLTVTCPTIIVTRTGGGSFPAATFNTAYTGQSFTASGGAGPYTFAVTAGTFPPGLSLSSAGVISGTPTTSGLFTNIEVTATDTVSLCSGSTTFSLAVSPIVNPDSYTTVGNTQLDGAGTPPSTTAFVASATNIIANDLGTGPLTVTSGTFATTQGGSITVNSDGTFIFTPKKGFTGSDQYTYTLNSNGATANGTITFTVTGMVWYVKNDVGGTGTGVSSDPYQTLSSASTASAIGDTIYVSTGDGTAANQGSIVLKDTQTLWGAGAPLPFTVGGITIIDPLAGTAPLLGNASTNVITVANNDTIKGVNVLVNNAGSGGMVIPSTHTGTTTIRDVNVTFSGSTFGLFIQAATPSGAVNWTNGSITSLNATSGSAAVQDAVANSVNVNLTNVPINVTDAGSLASQATNISNLSPGTTVTFNTGSTITAGTSLNRLTPPANGAVFVGSPNSGTVLFKAKLDLWTSGPGPAFRVDGGTVEVTDPTSAINTSSGLQTIVMSNATIGANGITFATVNATTSVDSVGLTTVNGGTLTINGGTISSTSGSPLNIQGGNGSVVIAAGATLSKTGGAQAVIAVGLTHTGTLTVNGTVTATSGLGMTFSTANGTYNINGTSTLSGSGGVDISSNSTGTFTFGSNTNINSPTAAGGAFRVSTGSPTVTYSGNVTENGAFLVVNISGTTANTVTFNTGTITGGASSLGVSIINVNGNVTFANLNLGTSGARMGSNAVTINGGTGTYSLGAVSIFTNAVRGIVGITPGGTINVASGTIDVLSQRAIDISGPAGFTTLGMNLTTVNVSTGSSNDIFLTNTSGTLNITNGTLTDGSTATFNVSSGSVGGTIGAAINQSAGRAVLIAGGHSGSFTFSGGVSSTGTSTGVSMAGSSGTYIFSGTNTFSGNGGIVIGPGESGTISFSNGTTNTTSGTPLQVANSTTVITYSGTINKTSAGKMIDINGLNSPGTVTTNHSPAAGGDLTINQVSATGISVINSSSANITISNASVGYGATGGPAFTGSGNTGTINLPGFTSSSSGGTGAGMLISGGGTINVNAGAINPNISVAGGTGRGIDGTTASYTGTLNLTNATISGNSTADIVTLTGSSLGGTGSTISGAQRALVLTNVALANGSGMTSVTSTGGTNGISLTTVTGGLYTVNGGSLAGNTSAGFSSTTTTANFAYAGSISNNTARVAIINNAAPGGCGTITLSGNLNATAGTGILVNNCNAGTITFSGGTKSIDTVTNPAVTITNNGATVNFTNGGLQLTTTTAAAFTATGGGTVTVQTGSSNNAISTTSGGAINIANTTVGVSGLTFASVSSSAATSAVVLDTFGNGVVNINGGTITAASTRGLDINGGGGDVNFAATITTSGTAAATHSVEVTAHSGGTVAMTAPITDNAGGINLTGNTGATITFSGGLTLSTAANPAFTATGGGTINVTGTNTATTTTGTALNVANTSIGASGLTFQSINKNGGTTSGIILSNTGAGPFTITGTGTTAGSGGTIQNIVGSDGMSLNTTGGLITLKNMIIQNISAATDATDAINTRSGIDGLQGQAVNAGLTVDNTTFQNISDSGMNGSVGGAGVPSPTSWTDLTVTNSTFTNMGRFNVANKGDATNEAGIYMLGIKGNVVVTGSHFTNDPSGLMFTTDTSGTLDMTVTGNTFTTMFKDIGTQEEGLVGISVRQAGSLSSVVRIGDKNDANSALGNTFTNGGGVAAIVVDTTSTATGAMKVEINQNTSTVTDHTSAGTSGGSTNYNFPQGGFSLSPETTGGFEAIIGHNTFDQVMHANGGLGQLSITNHHGTAEFIVQNNTFKMPWDAPVFIRSSADDGAPIANTQVLMQNNTYITGTVGNAGTDVGGPTPFDPDYFQALNGGRLDLTIKNDAIPANDPSSGFSHGFYAQTTSAGDILNLFVQNTSSSSGYELKASTGTTFNLFRNGSVQGTAQGVLNDNGNAGTAFLTGAGTVNLSNTLPVLPNITVQ